MRYEKSTPVDTGKPGQARTLVATSASRPTIEPRWSWPRFWDALRRSLGAVCF
ncbi:MAG TPA: hypothetical protein VKE74_11150 [Gemmataceae bacterium]|nr:hypothetical protein [Gemmataceae bacterium]